MKEVDINFLDKNEYYLFYEMMMQSLKTDDVVHGINKSLYLLKLCLSSGNVVLHKKNEDGVYTHYVSDSTMKEQSKTITCIVNKTSPLTEKKSIFNLELNLSDKYKNIMLIHFRTHDHDYILSINNFNTENKMNPDFTEKLRDTMQIILKRTESYEKNIKAISTDLLTGLDNRNSYEMRTQNINKDDNSLIYGLFDLFRLKYINDNYSHAIGDIYIKKAAEILDKYWPKQRIEIIDNEEKIIETGHCIYRIGGDEFVLLTNKEQIELTKIKASLAADEVSMINLGIDEDLPLGLNSGIISHTPGDHIKKTYKNADEIMIDDKQKMYKKYKLERRQI